MSNGRRLRRHHHEHTTEDVGVMVGWCSGDDESLEETKKATHDGLITLMGDRRRGGITWRIYKAGPGADNVMHHLFDGATPEQSDYYRRVAGHLREYGGVLVVATAPGAVE